MDSLTLVERPVMLPLPKSSSLMTGTRNPAKMVNRTNSVCQDGQHGQLVSAKMVSVRAGDHRLEIRNRQACQGRAWGDLAIPSTLSMSLEQKRDDDKL